MANNNVTGWTGWIYFAGFLMIVSGIFAGIRGLTALLNSSFYVITERGLAVFDVTQWGWIHLVLGMVVLSAGVAVINGSVWGRVVAVLLTLVSVVANLVFMPAYPVWSVVAIVIDVLVLYSLVVHGSEMSSTKS